MAKLVFPDDGHSVTLAHQEVQWFRSLYANPSLPVRGSADQFDYMLKYVRTYRLPLHVALSRSFIDEARYWGLFMPSLPLLIDEGDVRIGDVRVPGPSIQLHCGGDYHTPRNVALRQPHEITALRAKFHCVHVDGCGWSSIDACLDIHRAGSVHNDVLGLFERIHASMGRIADRHRKSCIVHRLQEATKQRPPWVM